MLERVPLLDKHLDDYADVVEPGTLERIRAAGRAAPRAPGSCTSTPPRTAAASPSCSPPTSPLLRDLGIEAEWQVIHGSDEFFGVTKAVHNALQGADVEWTTAMERIYLEKVLDNALLARRRVGLRRDPRPAARRDARASSATPASNGPNTKWIWRCHIDLTDANPDVWEFFRPFVEQYDASVWTMPEFVPASLPMDRIVHRAAVHRPAVGEEPRAARPVRAARSASSTASTPTARSSCQVSRFDPWKDPVGVIEAFRIVREEVPDVQLVLAGSMATDDPEGFHVWEHVDAARAGDPDIHLLSNIQQVGNVQINAFQRAADVVIQKSLREGFGLTVSEGLWKGRPVVGGRAGGITLQIHDGENGYLVDSVEECADPHASSCSRNPAGADEMGAAGPRARAPATSSRRASSRTGSGSSRRCSG